MSPSRNQQWTWQFWNSYECLIWLMYLYNLNPMTFPGNAETKKSCEVICFSLFKVYFTWWINFEQIQIASCKQQHKGNKFICRVSLLPSFFDAMPRQIRKETAEDTVHYDSKTKTAHLSTSTVRKKRGINCMSYSATFLQIFRFIPGAPAQRLAPSLGRWVLPYQLT